MSSNHPLVSTVITSFNKGDFLRETIDSALAQDYPEQEIVLVDDGSTDNTSEIAQSYGDRVRYVHQENKGQAVAKNTGVTGSHGSLIAYLDGDDRWHPSKLTKQVELLVSKPGVSLVYCDKLIFSGEETISGGDQKDRNRRFYRGMVLDQIMIDNFVPFSGILVKRSALDQVGLMNPECRVAPDYDLLLRLARLYEFDYVNEALLEYRVSSSSIGVQIGSKLEYCLRIQNNFVQEFYNGRFPRPRVIGRATAQKYKVRGDFQLSAGKNLQALSSYFTAFRHDPYSLGNYKNMFRALIPNRIALIAKGRLNQKLNSTTGVTPK